MLIPGMYAEVQLTLDIEERRTRRAGDGGRRGYRRSILGTPTPASNGGSSRRRST